MPDKVTINKKIGQTPLEALENFRREQIEASSNPSIKSKWQTIFMTYAGRLDPMAEGQLLILIGDECKKKDKYLKLDKEYEVEIVFGISTDSYDALGIAVSENQNNLDSSHLDKLDLQKFIGKFSQQYPSYSSKTVNGKQLHELARADQLPDEMPEKNVEIYSIDLISVFAIYQEVLLLRIFKAIDLVKGDFRQSEIKTRWNEILNKPEVSYETIKIKVKCSSGTYMRSLADRIGKDLGLGGFALSIHRTKIFEIDK